MENSYHQKTVAQIVRTDYRTADVFKKHGISYCCGGGVLFEDACLQKGLPPADVEEELARASARVSLPVNLPYEEWKLDFLIDYILNVYHAYLKTTLPLLGTTLTAFVSNHKKQYPYLENVLSLFEELSQSLQKHNLQEEDVIFPYIKQIDATYRRKEIYGSLFVKTLRKPLRNAETEHTKIHSLLLKLRSAAANYTYPDNACTTHRVIFQKLEELDNNLVHHQYLENNILFPRANEIEAELLQL